MTLEQNRNNKDWSEYLDNQAKIVFTDGFNRDGTEHISIKSGTIKKVTKTHLILLDERNTHHAINLLRIIRAEW